MPNTTEGPTAMPTVTGEPTASPSTTVRVTHNPSHSPTGSPIGNGPDVNVIRLPSFETDEPVNMVFIAIPMLLLILLLVIGCQRRRGVSHIL